MDVRINNLTSNIRATDSQAMLTPEVLEQIVQAVLIRLQEEIRQDAERLQDMQISQSDSM